MQPGSLTIPIVVDDIKQLDKLPLTRCTYFSVEQQQPPEHLVYWHQEEIDLPVVLLGFSGVIVGPTEDETHFNSPNDFDKLHEIVERHPEYFVDINEIWFPNSLFASDGHARGSVFRVSGQLFQLAYNFQQELLTLDAFLDSSLRFVDDLEYSGLETEALASWNERQIGYIGNYYHLSPSEYRLDKKPQFRMG